MRHIKLYEDFCEGDMEDMLSYCRKIAPLDVLHYGFDYIEVKLKSYGKYDLHEETEAKQQEMVDLLLDKFKKQISEVYTEETGWFKIYLNAKP